MSDMEVLFDASSLMKELTGIGVYVRDLLGEMIHLDSSIQYTIFMNAWKDPTPLFPWETAPNVRIVRRRIPGKLLLEFWKRGIPPSIEYLSGRTPDIFHSPNFFYHKSRSTRIVATIHDLAFMKRAAYGDRYSGRYHRETLAKNLTRIDRCIVVSEAVKRDLMDIFDVPEERITVIHHGMNPVFTPPDNMKETRKYLDMRQIPERYLLTVGTVESRKNIDLLVQAFGWIHKNQPDLHLVIAGKLGSGMGPVEQAIQQTGLKNHVILCGYIDLEFLLNLYRGAAAAVFPSWDEGFGFPPLEAMACGVPVLASDIPVHREVLGTSAAFFHPDSLESLEAALSKHLNTPSITNGQVDQGRQHAAMFSWKTAARRHIGIYQDLVS